MSKRVTLSDDEIEIILRFCQSDLDYTLGTDFIFRARRTYQTLLQRLADKLSADATAELPITKEVSNEKTT